MNLEAGMVSFCRKENRKDDFIFCLPEWKLNPEEDKINVVKNNKRSIFVID